MGDIFQHHVKCCMLCAVFGERKRPIRLAQKSTRRHRPPHPSRVFAKGRSIAQYASLREDCATVSLDQGGQSRDSGSSNPRSYDEGVCHQRGLCSFNKSQHINVGLNQAESNMVAHGDEIFVFLVYSVFVKKIKKQP